MFFLSHTFFLDNTLAPVEQTSQPPSRTSMCQLPLRNKALVSSCSDITFVFVIFLEMNAWFRPRGLTCILCLFCLAFLLHEGSPKDRQFMADCTHPSLSINFISLAFAWIEREYPSLTCLCLVVARIHYL